MLKNYLRSLFNLSYSSTHGRDRRRAKFRPALEVLEDRRLLANFVPIGPAPVTAPFSGRIDVAAPDPTNPNVMYVGANDGGIWKTTDWLDASPVWTPLTDKPQILSLAIHEHDLVVFPGNPNIVLAAASGPGGGILRSDDAGSTWSFLANSTFDLAEFGALVVDPNVPNAQTLYVAVSGGSVNLNFHDGLYKSVDGGKTWFEPFQPNIGHGFFLGFSGFVSDLLEVQENGQTVLYAADAGDVAANGGVYRSADGGVFWDDSNLPGNGTSYQSFRLAGSTLPTEKIYASWTDTSSVISRFVSSDMGGFWSPLAYPDAPGFDGSGKLSHRDHHNLLAVDPADSNTVFVNTDQESNLVHNKTEWIYWSNDGGQTWGAATVGGGDPVSGSFDSTGLFVETGDGGIFRDPVNVNDNKSGNLNTIEFYSFTLDPTNPQSAYGLFQDGPGVLKYTGNPDWQYTQPPGGQGESGKIRVDPTNPSRVYYLDPNTKDPAPGSASARFVHSDDGGITWLPAITGLPTFIDGNNNVITDYALFPGTDSIVMDPNNPKRLLLGVQNSVFETTTGGDPNAADPRFGGNGWRDIGANMGNTAIWNKGPNYISAIAMAPSDPNTVYAGTSNGQIFMTANAEDPINPPSWIEVDGGLPLQNQRIMDLKISPTDPNFVFAVTSPFVNRDDKAPDLSGFNHVWVTLNGGGVWIPINGNLSKELGGESLAVDWRPQSPTLYLGTQRGAFWSSDFGTTWTRFDSLPRTRVTDLDFVPGLNLLGAGTLGRGAWEMSVPGSPSFSYGLGCPNQGAAAAADSAGAANPVVQALGQAGYDAGYSVATDHAGNVYVAGQYDGCLNLPGVTPNVHLDGLGGADGFLAKYDALGSLLWARRLGGTLDDRATGVALAGLGSAEVGVYVTGTFQGDAAFGYTVLHATQPGAVDGFVAKLDSNGNFVWVHQFDTPSYIRPRGLAADGAGNAYITGDFSSSTSGKPADFDFLASPGVHVLHTVNDHANAFTVKLNAAGVFQWVEQISDPSGVTASAVALDAAGNVYTTGGYLSTATFPDGQIRTSAGAYNQYVLNTTPAGLVTWIALGVTAGIAEAFGIAADGAGNVYTTGTFSGASADFDPAGSHFALTSAGDGDVFVSKFSANGSFAWANRAGSTGYDQGSGIVLDQQGNPYVTGYISADAMFGNQVIAGSSGGTSFVSELDKNDGTFLCTAGSTPLAATASADRAFAIALDQGGYVAITGTFVNQARLPQASTTIFATFGNDAFIHKFLFQCSPILATVAHGHVLRIEGTSASDRIALSDDGRGNITATFDSDAPRRFQGIDRIEAITRGGNDTLQYQLDVPDILDSPNTRPADLMFDTGAGDDLVAISAHFARPTLPDRPWHIRVSTGDGNDTVLAHIDGGIPLDALVDLGNGDDRSIFDIREVGTPVREHVAIRAAAGMDDIRLTHHIVIQGGTASAGPSGGISDVIDGDGSDRVNVDYQFMSTGPFSAGAMPTYKVPLTTMITGADTVHVGYEYLPAPGGDRPQGLLIAAPITLQISGARRQANNVRVDFFNDAFAASFAPPMILIGAALDFRVTGGAKADMITVNVGSIMPGAPAPRLLDGASLNMLLGGGAGNDTIQAVLSFDPRSDGRLYARIFGGRGSDELTLDVYGADNLDLLLAVIDGGPGTDTFHHTRNERTVHCEK